MNAKGTACAGLEGQDSTQEVLAVAGDLRRRANRLRLVSRRLLIGIVAAVVVCLAGFWFAGYLAAHEERQRMGAGAEHFFNMMRGALEKGSAGWGGGLNFSSVAVTEAFEEALDRYLSAEVDRVNPLPVVVSTFTTRAGAVLVLVFFVQILVSMYRYKVRLASHYDACADVLQLASRRNDLNLSVLASLLSVKHIGFGKSLKLAPDQPTNLPKDLAGEE